MASPIHIVEDADEQSRVINAGHGCCSGAWNVYCCKDSVVVKKTMIMACCIPDHACDHPMNIDTQRKSVTRPWNVNRCELTVVIDKAMGVEPAAVKLIVPDDLSLRIDTVGIRNQRTWKINIVLAPLPFAKNRPLRWGSPSFQLHRLGR